MREKEDCDRESKIIVTKLVAISGGKDSTAMALRLREIEPDMQFEFCITPTGRELPEMQDHWKRIECLLGQSLIKIPGPSLMDLITKYQALPNWRMRWCTRQIKIEPFIAYAMEHRPCECYVGIRADESGEREGTNWKGIEGVIQVMPLVSWGWGIAKVTSYLEERGIKIPERTDCDWCFYQRISEWWRLWMNHPDKWEEGEVVEQWTGHTFRSENKDSWPGSMKGMREMFEKG